jgi:hypothetical protein
LKIIFKKKTGEQQQRGALVALKKKATEFFKQTKTWKAAAERCWSLLTLTRSHLLGLF